MIANKHRCFVIGNSRTRRDIDLHSLQGFTIGCNALYRDFSPDILVCIDKKMFAEIKENYKPPKGKSIHYYHDNALEVIGDMYNWNWQYSTGDSGVKALRLALDMGFKHIYLLGMDFYSNPEYDNVYANTQNYIKQTAPTQHTHKSAIKSIKNILDLPFVHHINPPSTLKGNPHIQRYFKEIE